MTAAALASTTAPAAAAGSQLVVHQQSLDFGLTRSPRPAPESAPHRTAPHLTVSPLSLDFGPLATGTPADPLAATITNDGTAPLDGLTIGVPGAAPFTIASTTCGADTAGSALTTSTSTSASTLASTGASNVRAMLWLAGSLILVGAALAFVRRRDRG